MELAVNTNPEIANLLGTPQNSQTPNRLAAHSHSGGNVLADHCKHAEDVVKPEIKLEPKQMTKYSFRVNLLILEYIEKSY